jgi:hypothetical protein
MSSLHLLNVVPLVDRAYTTVSLRAAGHGRRLGLGRQIPQVADGWHGGCQLGLNKGGGPWILLSP